MEISVANSNVFAVTLRLHGTQHFVVVDEEEAATGVNRIEVDEEVVAKIL